MAAVPEVELSPRWQEAQAAESSYWEHLGAAELLRISAEKPSFITDAGVGLFQDKRIIELGVGPLGVSVVSFRPATVKIKSLVKVDPLPQMMVTDVVGEAGGWEGELATLVWKLAQEGEYLCLAAEQMGLRDSADTVVIYNVLDHVSDPLRVLRTAHQALVPGGHVAVAVDCYSWVGRLRHELITRRRNPDSILVRAHPFTFVVSHVARLIRQAGFDEPLVRRVPSRLVRLVGQHHRPVFVASKVS